MAKKCSRCCGSGRVPNHLNPYGPKQGGGTFDVCPACGGRGKVGWGKDENDEGETSGARGGAHPVIWFFGLVGAFFCGIAKPLSFAAWFINAVFGFVVPGIAAGYLKERSWGKVVLWTLFVAIVAFFGAATYMAEPKQIS